MKRENRKGELKIEYIDKNITPFGGMKVLKDFMDRIEIYEDLKKVGLPYPKSNAGYDPIDIIKSFWLSIFVGASRYIHADWLRADKSLQEIFELKRMPSLSTYSRFFHKFSLRRNNEIFPKLQQLFLKRVDIDSLTIDLDSTVITRYGNQEGAKVGYNPKKPGRASHHPIIAFIDQTKMVANAWLRSGNSVSLSSYKAFLQETFEILHNHPIGLVRADSGFYANELLEWLEEKELNYIIAVKFYTNIQYEIGRITEWIPINPGIDVATLYLKHPNTSSHRRYVVVRKSLKNHPKASGRTLFDEPLYRYSAYVTNLSLPADQIYRLYNQRADAENRIKELKYDFAIDSFVLKGFFATEASFRFIMIAYNILALFKHSLLQSNHRLSTIRAYCFAIGSYITNHSNQKVLKMALSKKRRAWMDSLFEKNKNISLPIGGFG